MFGKKLVNSEFGRNVLTLMKGSVIAQLLPLIIMPILTRMISSEDFGVLTLFMSLAPFLMVIAAGRYEQAVVLPKEDKDAINVLALGFVILIFFVAILSLVTMVSVLTISDWGKMQALAEWIWLVPVTVFFGATYRIFNMWSNRKKRFGKTSVSLITQASTRSAAQLAGGFGKVGILSGQTGFMDFFRNAFSTSFKNPSGLSTLGSGTLIIGYAAGFVFGTFSLLISFFRFDRSLLKEVNRNSMKEQAKIYRNFPRINAIHALSDEFKNLGIAATIQYAFSAAIVGFYGMTYRVLHAPLALIGSSISQVFYQKAAEMYANGQDLVPLIKTTVRKMLLIATPIFLIILFFGPTIFEWYLGKDWRIAGVYCQYLTPWMYLNFAIAPVLQVSVIMNKQGAYFIVSLIHNVLVLGAILIGGFVFKDIITGFMILSALMIVFYVVVYRWVLNISAKTHSSNNKE